MIRARGEGESGLLLFLFLSSSRRLFPTGFAPRGRGLLAAGCPGQWQAGSPRVFSALPPSPRPPAGREPHSRGRPRGPPAAAFQGGGLRAGGAAGPGARSHRRREGDSPPLHAPGLLPAGLFPPPLPFLMNSLGQTRGGDAEGSGAASPPLRAALGPPGWPRPLRRAARRSGQAGQGRGRGGTSFVCR